MEFILSRKRSRTWILPARCKSVQSPGILTSSLWHTSSIKSYKTTLGKMMKKTTTMKRIMINKKKRSSKRRRKKRFKLHHNSKSQSYNRNRRPYLPRSFLSNTRHPRKHNSINKTSQRLHLAMSKSKKNMMRDNRLKARTKNNIHSAIMYQI